MVQEHPQPQTLHERAAESGRETRQAILALASGALAVFFVVLTSESEVSPPLQGFEKVILLISLLCMSSAVFASLWSAHADAQWSYAWAFELNPPADTEKSVVDWKAQRLRWHRRKRIGETLLVWTFAAGVLLAASYLVSRIYGFNP